MAPRRSSRRRHESAPGWVWMLGGLGLGLIVALVVYLRDVSPARAPQAEAALRTNDTAVPPPATPAETEPALPAAASAEPTAESRFEFYDILPQFEVVLPEYETPALPDPETRSVEAPGRYVLQAGSFTSLPDADRRQASLALLGIESRIQRVVIDDAEYHRVRIGPIDDLDELNQLRRRLRDAQIESLLMQVQ